MKVLVVDDTEATLLLISRFVEALGHTVVQALDGREAVEKWCQDQPDLVLMDMIMPVMSGLEAAVAIKSGAGQLWVPIVLVTGVGEEDRLADAIEQGADDYINKPVNFRVLGAKLKAFERTLELNRQVREQSARLASYYDTAEEEKRVVRHLMDQMVNAERLNDPMLDYWLCAAESLSGDMIAAARTPDRVLYVMLADGIGHGLTAALNVLPLTQPFYAMAEKGYALCDILVEMNDKVRQVLPVGRFVAVALIAINEAAGCVEVWNGGMPTVLVLDRAGEVVHQWKSSHLPLGIVPTREMEATTSCFYYSAPGTVLACSDGLLEARAADDEVFSEPRLLGVLQQHAQEYRLQAIKNALSKHLGSMPQHDDISLVMMRFGEQTGAEEKPQSAVLSVPEVLTGGGACLWRYGVTLGAEMLRSINVMPFMMAFVSEVTALQHSRSEVSLVLSELFNNALDHGLLGMDSHLKQKEQGMDRYLLERGQRLATLTQGQVSIDLQGLRIDGRAVLRIRVKDTGPGFDWSRFNWPDGNQSRVHGRGLMLVRSLCAVMQFSSCGNEVAVHYLPRQVTD